MIGLTDFLPYVLPYADGVPEFVVQDAVLATVQDFYRRTKEKEVDLDPVDAVADQSVYTLSVANAHLFEISSALYSGRGLTPGDPAKFATEIGDDWRLRTGTPTYFYMPGLDQIRLVITPNLSQTGVIRVSGPIYPSRTATQFDEILIEEHRDLIVAGALFRLLTQQDQKWTDFKQGAARGMIYDALVAAHARRVARGRGHSRKKIVGHYF